LQYYFRAAIQYPMIAQRALLVCFLCAALAAVRAQSKLPTPRRGSYLATLGGGKEMMLGAGSNANMNPSIDI
jgi:hypothetical protein